MQTRKLLTIFLAISMALSFSACGREKSSDSSTAEVTTQDEQSSYVDWDITDITDNIYVENQKLSLPISISNLESNFKVIISDNETSYIHNTSVKSGKLFYKNDLIAFISAVSKDEKALDTNGEIYSISTGEISNNDLIPVDVLFGKIKMGMTRSDVEKIYGNGNNASKNVFYKFESADTEFDNTLIIEYDDSNLVKSMSIRYIYF